MNATPQHVIACLNAGQISEKEATYYLHEIHGMTLEQARGPKKPVLAYFLTILCVLALTGFVAFDNMSSITGYLTLEAPDDVMTIPQSALGLNVSGFLYGDGNATIIYETGNGSFIVARLTSDTGEVRTQRPSYAPGDSVALDHSPTNATYYLDDGATSTAVEIPFAAPNVTSTLLIVSQLNGTAVTTRIPVVIGDAMRQTVFTNQCVETCSLTGMSGLLRVETTGTARVNITSVHIRTNGANQEPVLAVAIPPVVVSSAITIDLDDYFVDADGDALSYSVGTSPYVDATVSGAALTLIPVQAGAGTLSVYVSDLKTLVPASIAITVPGTAVIAPIESQNTTTGDNQSQNTTINTITAHNLTQNVTNTSVDVPVQQLPTLDCSSSNPNERPVDCLNIAASTYFEEDIFLENTDRARVARITPIGNLILKGRVFKQDTGTPGPRDFTIGYKDSDFNYVATAWIDDQGHLHLRGQLYEENENLIPPSGSYAVINRRGVYMAYANTEAGDLYLRGNVIMYKEAVDE